MEKGLLFSFFHLYLYEDMQRNNRFHAGVNFKGQSHRAVGMYVIAVFIVLHGLWFIYVLCHPPRVIFNEMPFKGTSSKYTVPREGGGQVVELSKGHMWRGYPTSRWQMNLEHTSECSMGE